MCFAHSEVSWRYVNSYVSITVVFSEFIHACLCVKPFHQPAALSFSKMETRFNLARVSSLTRPKLREDFVSLSSSIDLVLLSQSTMFETQRSHQRKILNVADIQFQVAALNNLHSLPHSSNPINFKLYVHRVS